MLSLKSKNLKPTSHYLNHLYGLHYTFIYTCKVKCRLNNTHMAPDLNEVLEFTQKMRKKPKNRADIIAAQ